jgi:hypothetical protein
MGRARSTYEEEEECVQGFGGKGRRGQQEAMDVYGRIILKWIL